MSDCTACNRPMISQSIYRQDVARWRAQGVVRHGGGDLCNSCYTRHRRVGDAVPGLVPGRRRRAPGNGPLSDAEVTQLRAAVGLAAAS
jgi:hypothetical protein